MLNQQPVEEKKTRRQYIKKSSYVIITGTAGLGGELGLDPKELRLEHGLGSKELGGKHGLGSKELGGEHGLGPKELGDRG